MLEHSSEHSASYLSARDEFVQIWGDMASAWGINKTMAQVHALLMISTKPLNSDEVMEKLAG